MNPAPLNLRDPTADPAFSYETTKDLYLFTSLTAGSSHILTATSRLETILKANRIPFQAVDTATDEKARRIWGRRAGGKKLPGLVREGQVVADLEQVEEWNEFGEIKENLGARQGSAQQQQQQQQQQPVHATIATKASEAQAQPSTASSTSKGGGVETAPAPAPAAESKTSAQTLQQKQQSALASEAAAAAKSRGKPKPTPATAPSTVPSSTSTNDGTVEVPRTPPPTADPMTPNSPSANSPRAAEEEAAEAFSRDDEHPKHNMSANAGLPPLSLRTKSTSPTAASRSEGRDRGESIAYPSAPPPTAVEPPSDAGEGECPPEPVVAAAEEKDSEKPESKVVEEGAAPATKSGLSAVSSDPSAMAASMGSADGAGSAVETGTKREHRSSSITQASEEEVKAVESRDSIPETAAEEAEDNDSQDRGEGLGDKGQAQKVKFDEDQKKGDPTDTGKAEESLQD